MKKTLLTAAAVLISASAFAQTVTSANIVGYTKKNAPEGDFIIVAPQFIAENEGGVTLSNAFSGVAELTEVYTWDGVYGQYLYSSLGGGWLDVNNGYNPANNVIITQSSSVWLKSGATTNVMMSGEVPNDSSITNVIAPGFNLVANPYPIEFELGSIPTNSLPELSEIYTWDGVYGQYLYSSAGGGWLDVNNGYNPANNNTISVGDGFWLKNPSVDSFELIFDKQY